jgi:hypothetical protein
MDDPSLILLLGPRAGRLNESISRVLSEGDKEGIPRARLVSIVPDVPDGFLASARAADIYYAYAQTPAISGAGEAGVNEQGRDGEPNLETAIKGAADSARDLVTTQAVTQGVSRLIVILVGFATCPVTLGLWFSVARSIREQLRQRLAGLPQNVSVEYMGIACLPLEASAEDERWRDAERYAWLREVHACDWFRYHFFLSRAGADWEGGGRPVLTEEDMDDLIAACAHALVRTGLIDALPLPLLDQATRTGTSSLGVFCLDLSIGRIRLSAAKMTAADVIAALLSRRSPVTRKEAREALGEKELGGAGMLDRLLETTRPGENLVNQLILPSLEYDQVREIGELPDRLRSYSAWLGQQRVSQLADRLDANRDSILASIPQDVHEVTLARADSGPESSPDYGRNFLSAAWDEVDEVQRQVDQASSLEGLARLFGSADLADQVTVETTDEADLDRWYDRLGDAIRNRVVPLAAFLRFGLLGTLPAALALMRLGSQFGAWVAWPVAAVFFASGLTTAALTCLQSRRRIIRRRDAYMDAIVQFHRGNFFRYAIEQLRKANGALREAIGDPANIRAQEYETSELRVLGDAEAALELRGESFRQPPPSYGNRFVKSAEEMIEPFPTYRFRRYETVDPNALLAELTSSGRIGWLPGPGERLENKIDDAANRVLEFCNQGFDYLEGISLRSLLAPNASPGCLAGIRVTIDSTARYYHPAVPIPGSSPVWFLGLSGSPRGEIRQALQAPDGWLPMVNDLPLSVQNRLAAVNVGWNLNVREVDLFGYWRRAYLDEDDPALLHPGVDEATQLPDPLAETEVEEVPEDRRTFEVPPPAPEPLV